MLVRDDSSSGTNDLQTGTYGLYFVKTPGANELGELANDSINAESIDLDDLDTYTFSANAGDHVVLRVADTSGTNFFPRIELYDPSGANVGAGNGQNVGTVEHDATATGTFTVLIKDNQSSSGADAGTGDYILRFGIDGGGGGGQTYTVGIRPPTDLNLDNMAIAEGKFILTSVIGYSAANLGSELLMTPIEVDATIGSDSFHVLLDVPSDVEVLNLIGRFEATSPAKPPVQFDYIMGAIDTAGPDANTISLPLFTDGFFYQITDLSTGEDIFVDGSDPKPDISLRVLAQSLATVTGTNTWHIGYPSQITLRTPRPGQPHGTLGTSSSVSNSPVNLNNAPVVEDAAITVTPGETVIHTFTAVDPDSDSLIWNFVDITGASVDLQPTFDPDTQLLTWDTTGSAAPGTFVLRVSAVDPGNQGDIGTLTVNITALVVVLPDVVGLDQATAEETIVNAGLIIGSVTTSNSDTLPVGSVISQDPTGGTTIGLGAAVNLVISLGSGSCTVPDLTGQSQA